MTRPGLLFITSILPYPLDDGASIKAYHTLKYLSRSYDITLISFIRSAEEKRFEAALKEFCPTLDTVLIRRSRLGDIFFFAASLFSRKPFLVRRDFRKKMQRKIRARSRQADFDTVYVDHLQMSQYLEPRLNRLRRKIVDEHNIESSLVHRYYLRQKNVLFKPLAFLEQWKMRRYEARECRKYDLVLTVTERDQKLLAGLGIAKVFCLPIGVDTAALRPAPSVPDPKDILFLGTMYWPPNEDAALWFAEEILPLIKKECPDSRLLIIGRRPSKTLRRLEQNGHIQVPGFVDDLSGPLSQCAAFVVPLRIGGGMRVKILNAFAWGLPVVSTSIGVEGIDAADGIHLLIRDQAEDFAEAVIRLLKDASLRKALSEEGRRLVETHYAWERIFKRMDRAFEQGNDP